MQIILKKDVANLGHADDVVTAFLNVNFQIFTNICPANGRGA